MAAVDRKTPADEVADALRAVDAVTGELERWRCHLERLREEPAVAWQARRSGRIVAALVDSAQRHVREYEVACARPR